MRSFTAGFIAGSIIGVAGLGWAFSDKGTRRRAARNVKKVAEKATDAISDIF